MRVLSRSTIDFVYGTCKSCGGSGWMTGPEHFERECTDCQQHGMSWHVKVNDYPELWMTSAPCKNPAGRIR